VRVMAAYVAACQLATLFLCLAWGSPAGGLRFFPLEPLPYPYDALEPHIDTLTMQLHHDRHHQVYTDKFNEALEKLDAGGGLASMAPNATAEAILRAFHTLSFPTAQLATAVRNHGGGYVNHNMFWRVLTPGGPQEPQGELALAINDRFGSLYELKSQFNAAAASVFGSGWAWLVVTPGQASPFLEIVATPNQDSPLMAGQYPVLCLDVWEHAYYLRHHNRRPDYIQSWWHVVNWDVVSQYYTEALILATPHTVPPGGEVILSS